MPWLYSLWMLVSDSKRTGDVLGVDGVSWWKKLSPGKRKRYENVYEVWRR